MFLNLSPLAVHLNESLCSLRFATKASIKNKEECAADALRGTGQQHTNRNRKKASQEYLISSLHLRHGPSCPCDVTLLVLSRLRLSHTRLSLAEQVFPSVIYDDYCFFFLFLLSMVQRYCHKGGGTDNILYTSYDNTSYCEMYGAWMASVLFSHHLVAIRLLLEWNKSECFLSGL